MSESAQNCRLSNIPKKVAWFSLLLMELANVIKSDNEIESFTAGAKVLITTLLWLSL